MHRDDHALGIQLLVRAAGSLERRVATEPALDISKVERVLSNSFMTLDTYFLETCSIVPSPPQFPPPPLLIEIVSFVSGVTI